MKVIVVTCTDGSDSCYRARSGQHTATATCSQEYAVKRAAAKALGLCPARKPDAWYMGAYCAAVDAATASVSIKRIDATHFEAHADGGAA